MTSLPAVDGTLFTLAATGRLATPAVAFTVGLTIIAGAGAWLAAREEFGGRSGDARTLGWVAVVSTVLTVAAVAAGVAVGAHVTLAVMPTAAGLALLAIAADMAGARTPRIARLPLATCVILAGVIGEVAAWTL